MIGNNRELEKFVMNLHLITDSHTNKSGQTRKRLTLFAIILHANHKKFVDIGQLIDLVVPVDTLRDFLSLIAFALYSNYIFLLMKQALSFVHLLLLLYDFEIKK